MQTERSTIRKDQPVVVLERELAGAKCLDCPGCKGICAAIVDAMTVPAIIMRRGRS